MWPFKNKIREKNFFDYEKRKLNIKGIKASIPNDKLPVELSVGEISKENFPQDVTDKLKELDLLQLQIARAINSMVGGTDKEIKKGKYIEVLLDMFRIAQKSTSGIETKLKKKGQLNSDDLYNFYNNSGYEIANITKYDLNNPGLIIWPVALQDRPTIIHKAQIEIIKILQLKDWKLKILIADCGTFNIERKIVQFKEELEKHLRKRDIEFEHIGLLSDYYIPDPNGGNILKKFTEISSKLKISELKEYNTKQDSYSEENKVKVENRYTLKFIQPVLTWSVIIHEADKYSEDYPGKKAIIIAGQDELNQWKYIFGFSSNIGGVFNLILKDEGKNTIPFII